MMNDPNQEIERLIRKPELARLLGLKPSHLDVMIRRGDFPRGRRLGPRLVIWTPSDVARWQANCRVPRAEFQHLS